MLEILLPALLAAGALAALLRQAAAARAGYREDAARRQFKLEEEERDRQYRERNARRTARQEQHAEWTHQFSAIQIENHRRHHPPEPAPEPEGEPLAVIRAWDGTIVREIYDQPETNSVLIRAAAAPWRL
ncbi:hypothetical protein PBI_LUNAR_29 [Arthrobacter phage Lunar]|uniref:Uncharacterized protein n=3 Tax=Coralvirus coral TaxID=2734227 RepID=A0A3G2KHI5_9CAUD|nr:hypothetical protein PBI_COTE_29 [Arthrobacter phage Cote]AYN58436.1 hypothetical protein PBI_LUNAR_29 [Arthrobacter phage Lunar]AYN58619.1 hypothetical protein PBI_MELONS_29 [Arthrobacter phage Melons]